MLQRVDGRSFCSSRVYFKSGNPEHPGDKFFNTTVDLQSYVQPKEKVPYPKDNDGFYTIAHFSHDTGIAEAVVDKVLGPISTIRLKVHSKSEAWIILNEVRSLHSLEYPTSISPHFRF